jgi:outer membrane protein assembly factor BamB
MKSGILIITTLFIITHTSFSFSSEKYSDNWPQWRGPEATGVSADGTPPVEWSETKNIKWKIQVPGKGLSTPVIWGNQIFITSAIELNKKATQEAIKKLQKTSRLFQKVLNMSKTTENFIRFVVYSVNRQTGEIMWEKTVREQFPHENIQNNGSWASGSCVTDGELVIASFGSYGIYCFDMSGKLIWETDLGDMKVELAVGEGTSPVIYNNSVIINWDHEGQSKIFALDKRTGAEIWQRSRDSFSTWATPVAAKVNGNMQIIVPGTAKSRGYDAATGDVIWELKGLDRGIVASPVSDGEYVYLMNGYMGSAIQAIDLKSAKGNIDNSKAVTWISDKDAPYVPSPLLMGGKIYYLKGTNSGLTCTDAVTGKVYYKNKKAEGMGSAYASPVWANGNIYVMDRKGNCAVIIEETEFKVKAVNKLNDKFDASPAVAGNDLILRGFESLYCISENSN